MVRNDLEVARPNGSADLTTVLVYPKTATTFLLDRSELDEAMSNSIYNQQRMLSRHVRRLEVARQLNTKLKRKSVRMLKVAKHPKRRP